MDDLKRLRQEIDILDEKIMQLLEQRFDISLAVGIVKKSSDIQVLDSKREDEIFLKTSSFRHSPQLLEIYKTIMEQSKSLQRK